MRLTQLKRIPRRNKQNHAQHRSAHTVVAQSPIFDFPLDVLSGSTVLDKPSNSAECRRETIKNVVFKWGNLTFPQSDPQGSHVCPRWSRSVPVNGPCGNKLSFSRATAPTFLTRDVFTSPTEEDELFKRQRNQQLVNVLCIIDSFSLPNQDVSHFNTFLIELLAALIRKIKIYNNTSFKNYILENCSAADDHYHRYHNLCTAEARSRALAEVTFVVLTSVSEAFRVRTD